MTTTVKAQLRFLHITPRKTRAVASLLRGLPVSEAEAQLMLSPRRSAAPLLKLLRSAVANATHNFKLEPEKLFVKEIRVNLGPKTKRWTPRARGAVALIEKKTSHVDLVLGVSEEPKKSRFTIVKPEKKEKKEKKAKAEKQAEKPEKEQQKKPVVEKEKPVAKKGFLKQMFRRKSI